MKPLLILAVFSLALIVLVACAPSQPAASSTPRPTETVIPTYSYQQPTQSSVFANLSTAEATAQATAGVNAGTALDPELVSRGQSRYTALACNTCHGDKGEGTDKGKALAGTTLNEADFTQFLRTGGTVGNSHLFLSGKLNPTGAHNLYLYVLSLAPAS